MWDAWTTAEHLAHWWGPNGFNITTYEFDFRIGGLWRFMMHWPDGRDYPNHVVFTDIVELQVIAHDHGGDDGKVHFQATATFEDVEGKIHVTMRLVFPSVKEREQVVKEYGAIEGGKQTLGRLAEYVETMK